MMGYVDISTVRRLHKGHWFDAVALRFFRSRFSEAAVQHDGGYLFVSSERFDHKTPRFYSVRFCDADGNIETIGDFQEYKSGRQAWAAILRMVKGAI